jgi:hypothetical protein
MAHRVSTHPAGKTDSRRWSQINHSQTRIDTRSATGKNLEMVELLHDLRDQVSEGGRTKIDDLLSSVRRLLR